MRLGGVSEVAVLLGVSRQQVTKLRERPEFPSPMAEIASGPIWDLDELERWLSSGVRRSPGRPAADEHLVGSRFALETPALGSGGFADVYRALDRKSGEVVAVKVLKASAAIDPEAVTRFRRELRLMSDSMDHPNVARVLAFGGFEDGNSEIWCAMPIAVGSLADQIGTFKDDLPEIIDMARQVCAGVGHAHSQGILHRDLKPANILRGEDGNWQVSDFGLAREDERKSAALTTTLAQGMGTYFYASPEQWSRPKYADKRDDIFSIGKILQQAVTGSLPFEPAEQMMEHPLRPVIQRATGPRDNRYATTDDLLRAVEQAVETHSVAWIDPEDRLARLRPRLAAPALDTIAAEELLEWMQVDDNDEIDGASRALVASSDGVVRWMWTTNPTGFRAGYRRVSEWMRTRGFGFEYCDSIANNARMVVAVTADNDTLRSAVRGLLELGPSHNRWHVRDVLIALLQEIRGAEKATVALEAVQAGAPSHVAWTFHDFGLRSMHPVLRDGIKKILDDQKQAS